MQKNLDPLEVIPEKLGYFERNHSKPLQLFFEAIEILN